MTRKKKSVKEPEKQYRFNLPGEDSLDVEVEAYSHGLNIMARMALEQLPPGKALPEAFLTNFPIEQEDIDKTVGELAIFRLTEASDNYVTNSPELYCEHYTKGFKEGYRFGLYAFSHGYLELSYSLPDTDRRYELAYRFAYEKIKQEPSPDTDTVMSSSLEELKAIYKQYQMLN